MKSLNFQSIPKYCISLKNSPRRKDVASDFKKAGLTVTFFDAINKKNVIVPELSDKRNIPQDAGHMDGILACMMSHVALIKMAKEKRLPAICIFEDDVIFCDDFQERISYLEKADLDFDMITLGGHFQLSDVKHQPQDIDAIKTKHRHIYKVLRQSGTYGYIITEKVYDFVLRNCTYNFGMDQFYYDHVYHRFNCYAMLPFPCSTRPGISEITGATGKYDNIDWFYEQDRLVDEVKKMPEPWKNVDPSFVDLRDCTFITAVKIDSKDREFNFLRVIQYLCDHFVTHIIIKESDRYSRVVELMQFIDRKHCDIQFTFEKNETNIFHRTRLLNEALVTVKTPVTVNYDIDVFMIPDAYVKARDKVIDGWDLVYPYKQGDDIQKMVIVPEHVKAEYRGENLFNPEWLKSHQSYCGHVQFFNTKSYIAGGMENEYMVSYGPEDRERCERFIRLGWKVCWLEDCVYHIEHSRDENSSTQNPHFGSNDALMNRFRAMSDNEIKEYYETVPYLKKYKNVGIEI